MNIDQNKYIALIKQKEQDLVSTIHAETNAVKLPTPSTNEVMVRPQAHGANPKLIGAGIVAACAGLCFSNENPLKWILISVGSISCAYGYLSHQPAKTMHSNPKDENTVDYFTLSSAVSKNLHQIYTSIVEEWDKFVKMQKDEIKDVVMRMDSDVNTKDRLLSKAMQVAVIDFSMSDAQMELNAAANSQNIMAIKFAIENFERKMTQALQNACNEQIKYWSQFEV